MRHLKEMWYISRRGRGRRAISEVVATIILVCVTIALAIGLYLLLTYYAVGLT